MVVVLQSAHKTNLCPLRSGNYITSVIARDSTSERKDVEGK
jgi:hypothetical protein